MGVSSFLYIGEGEEAICMYICIHMGKGGRGGGVAVHSFEPFLVI